MQEQKRNDSISKLSIHFRSGVSLTQKFEPKIPHRRQGLSANCPGANDQDMTLEDMIKITEAAEAGRQSQATFQNQSAATLYLYKQADKDQRLVKCRNYIKPGCSDDRSTQARKEKKQNLFKVWQTEPLPQRLLV